MVIMNNLSRIYAISCQETINPLIRSHVHCPWTIDQKACTLPLDYCVSIICYAKKIQICIYNLKPTLLIPSRAGAVVQR